MAKREMIDTLERPSLFKELKVVLVGPAKCGKSALIQRFVADTFNDCYIPTGFEKYSTRSKIGDYTVEYTIWDTSGSEAYDTVRPLAYQDAQVFILCFSKIDPESLELTLTKWLPEIRKHCPLTPILLCGCKLDLLDNMKTLILNKHKFVTREQAIYACEYIGAIGYVEVCSRYLNSTVNELFHIAAERALNISSLDILSTKNVTKKRKIYSIRTLTLDRCSEAKQKSNYLKSEIKKSTKNCNIM